MTTPEAVAEERLRVEAAQRDPSRFAELYEAHFERVYAYAVRRVRDRHEAEDVTAEVFQQALANLGRFEWRGVPFAAWLFRIAANAIADRAKRATRERGNPGPEPETEPEPVLDWRCPPRPSWPRSGASPWIWWASPTRASGPASRPIWEGEQRA